MQVDAHLPANLGRGTFNDFIRGNTISYLAQVLYASTGGVNPLWMDWTLEDNHALLDNDMDALFLMRNLQRIARTYGTKQV